MECIAHNMKTNNSKHVQFPAGVHLNIFWGDGICVYKYLFEHVYTDINISAGPLVGHTAVRPISGAVYTGSRFRLQFQVQLQLQGSASGYKFRKSYSYRFKYRYKSTVTGSSTSKKVLFPLLSGSPPQPGTR